MTIDFVPATDVLPPSEKVSMKRKKLLTLRRQYVLEELQETPQIIVEAARVMGMKVEPA